MTDGELKKKKSGLGKKVARAIGRFCACRNEVKTWAALGARAVGRSVRKLRAVVDRLGGRTEKYVYLLTDTFLILSLIHI